MENKKLVNILQKDVEELEELIVEMKSNQQFDALSLEIMHTRTKGMLQLLQMIKFHEVVTGDNLQEKEKPGFTSMGVSEGIRSESAPDIPKDQIKVGAESFIPERKEKTKAATHELDDDPIFTSGMKVEKTEWNGQIPPADSRSDDDMLVEDSDSNPIASRIGDSFLKGRSVNDMKTDQQKLEFKLSNRPVTSIQSAIGINDRFQYIRELFDGDKSRFAEAVKALDSMENMEDAVNYLRIHYKWKKNETSLKFIHLVKRRFLHV